MVNRRRKILKFAKEKGLTTTFDLVAIDRPDLMDLIAPCLPYIDYFMPGSGGGGDDDGHEESKRHHLLFPRSGSEDHRIQDGSTREQHRDAPQRRSGGDTHSHLQDPAGRHDRMRGRILRGVHYRPSPGLRHREKGASGSRRTPRRYQEIGLPAEERRYLDHVENFPCHGGLVGGVNVRNYREPGFLSNII